MAKAARINRRVFVQTSAIAALGSRALFSAVRPDLPRAPRLAFVGAMGQSNGIHVYATEDRGWKPLQFVPSESPVSLALHPSGHSLYVLNEISEYQGLPLGTVEAHHLDAKTGQLTLLNRQPLALSATMPRHLAVAPNGKTLVVAVHGGGAYNALPILNDGALGRVCSAVKETGNGPAAEHQQSAHPQTVVFDATGSRFISADLGSDRLSVYSLSEEAGSMAASARIGLTPGSGPRHLVLHPKSGVIYVDHAMEAAISGYRYDPVTGTIGERCVSVQGEFGDALAIHPGGNALYSASKGRLSSWRIGGAAKDLQPMQTITLVTGAIHTIEPLPDGSAIVVLTDRGAFRVDIEDVYERFDSVALVAEVSDARCITM